MTSPSTLNPKSPPTPTVQISWLWFAIGVGLAGLGVALGAAGTHTLRDLIVSKYENEFVLLERLNVWEVAVRYQMYHAFALMILGLVGKRIRTTNLVGWLFLIGTSIFSGSLYTLVLTDIGIFGFIVVFGGLSQLIGWFTLMANAFLAALKPRQDLA